MGELGWEDLPPVNVPMVRGWIGPAFEAWTRGCYPHRRRSFIVWGWFLPIWGLFVLLKLGIYAAGIVVMLLANVAWILMELATYHHRVTQARARRS